VILPLLLAWQEVPAAPPPSDAEIVVMARKMRMLRVSVKAPKRNGKLVLQRCGIDNSTGNAAIDRIPCEVAQECIAEAPATRKQLAQCIEERSQPRLDAALAAWKATRA